MKHILAINFSQSGQLTEIVQNIVAPLSEAFEVEHIVYRSQKKYPFPWTKQEFFDAMPYSVLKIGDIPEDFEFKREKYDLIIFGYQPWFLSVSPPAMGLLQWHKFRNLLQDTAVITVIGSRNMWINAQEDVKTELNACGAKLVGNIPLIDRHQNFISAITIQHWAFTGKKTRKWGFFPLPGISQEDIDFGRDFGKIIRAHVEKNDFTGLQEKILETNKISIAWDILFIEGRAKKLFNIWANLIHSKGSTPRKRKFWLKAFNVYLSFALFIIAPILLTIYGILLRPFFLSAEKRKKFVILHV